MKVDADNRIDAAEHAAGGADAFVAVEVTGRLKLVDLVFAVLQVVEAVFAVGVRGRGPNHLPLGVAKLDRDAAQENLRVIPVAFRAAVGEDPAGDRRGQLFAEVVLRGVRAGMKLDVTYRIVASQNAARGADALVAIEISGRLELVDLVLHRAPGYRSGIRRWRWL